MKLPDSVERQVEAAEAAEQAIEEQGGAVHVAAPSPVVTPVLRPAVEPAAGGVSREEHEALLQRYRSLNGMITSRDKRIEELEAKLDQFMQEAESKEPGYLKYVDEETRREFGDDVLAVHAKVAKGESEARTKKLEERLAQLEASQSHSVAVSFWGEVERQRPGTDAMNESDENWGVFLDSTERLTGRPYRELATEARDAGDVLKFVAIVDAYVGSGSARRAAVDSQIKPSVSAGSRESQTDADGKVWVKESEIRAFYQDQAVGRVKVTKDEEAKIEAIIESAIDEGRVLYGQ